MEYVWYLIVGVAGGILGGMGMGGGTVLIPLLSIVCGVTQKTAQAVNLISFIPLAIVSLVIHIKNKLVKFDKILLIILPGIATCVLGCYLARAMSGDLLKRCFGGFLILLSVFQFTECLIKKKR